MTTQFDVAKRTLALADTMDEALKHMHERHSQGHPLEETASLFTDVVQAFTEIRTAFEGFPGLADDEQLVDATDSLQDGLHRMTEAFEGKAAEGSLTILKLTLLPRFEMWRDQLRRLLLPLVAS